MRQGLRKLRTYCELPALRLAAMLFERPSRERVLRRAARIGALAWLLMPESRRRCEANLRVMYGSKISKRRKKIITKGCFKHMARFLADFFWFSSGDSDRVLEWMSLEDRLLKWFEDNRNGIVVTGHLGGWEAAGQMAAACGYPLTSVAQQIGTESTTAEINRRRASLGQRIVMLEGTIRSLMYTLRRGGHVALVMDQYVDPSQGGVWVDFFGHPACFSNAAAKLSRKLDVPVVVCVALAMPDGRYRGRLIEEILPSADETSEMMTQRIAAALERAIRRFPSQWLLRYKRWKHWPLGANPADYPYYARPWR